MTGLEERGDPRMVQGIRRLVTTGDHSAVLDYIKGIAPDELAEARTWFAKSGRFLLRDDADGRIHDRARRVVDLLSRSTVRDVVTVAVSSPGNAARFLPWRNLASSRNVQVLILVDVLVSKGEDWCRSFVTAAIARNAKAERNTAAAVIRYCLPLILHFAVPTHDMPAYPRLWALYYGELRWRIHDAWDAESAERFEYPSWGGLQFRISQAGSCQILPRTQKQLLELLDFDDTAPGSLMRCFDTPDALAPFKGAGIGDTLCGYIRRGVLTREDVLEKAETALSRSDGTPNQRLLAEVLAALQPDPQEVARIIPLLLSTVATAAGFLSFQALELLLTAPLTGGDLQELSAAVFGRSEKKSQVLLSRHLRSLRADEFDEGVLTGCWEEAMGSSDLRMRTLAKSMLGLPREMAPEEQFAPAPLWGTGAGQPPEVPPYVVLEVDPENPLPWWDRTGKHTVVEEQHLDRFLRAVYHAPQDFRDWYKQRRPILWRDFHGPLPRVPDYWAYPDQDVVLATWASGDHDLTAHTFLAARLRASVSGPWNWQDDFCRLHAFAVVRRLRLSELTVQAGTIAYSLATPSFSDFRVGLDRLVRLLQLYAREGWQYGEADFLQALLRLGPVDSTLAAAVPDIEVMPLGGSAEPGRQAGEILRDWIAGGSFAPPAVNEAPVLPIPLERFPSIPPELLSVDIWTGGKEWQYGNWLETATVVPFWPDLGAVWSRQRNFYEDLVRLQAGDLAGATAGGIGLLTHEWLITKLSARDPEDAVGTTLELAKRRLLPAQHLAPAARNRMNAGALSLGRLTRNLALVAHEGHLDVVWPAFAALVAAAVALPKLPAGTPELLAACSELWEAIPPQQRTSAKSAEFTAAVLKLAAAKGSTKSSLEAKRLAAQMGITA